MADIDVGPGGTTLTGKGIDLYQLAAIKGMLKLHMRGLNVRNITLVRSKARELTGSKAKKDDALLADIEALLVDTRAACTFKESK